MFYMAISMEQDCMGGDFGCNFSKMYDNGCKVSPTLRAIPIVRRRAAEWELDPTSSDVCGGTSMSMSMSSQERTWKALEPTIIGNRVKWTCTVFSPKSSDRGKLPSNDAEHSGLDGFQDNLSDSLTSTLTAETDNGHLISDLDAFHSSPLCTLGEDVDLLGMPGGTGEVAHCPLGSDGYSDFELLSGQFPIISPNFEANEDSNSCESVASQQWSGNLTDRDVNHSDFSCNIEDARMREEDEAGLSSGVLRSNLPTSFGDNVLGSSLYPRNISYPPADVYKENQQNEILDKERCGVELVQLLLACAETIATGDLLSAQHLVERLYCLLSPRGSSMERLAIYFTEALSARLGVKERPYDVPEQYLGLSVMEQVSVAYQVFYASCPYLIVTHFTANQAILEAFEGEEKVHIVDLDIKQGLQWPSLIQALSLRKEGSSQLRITGVVGSSPDLPNIIATRQRLLEFADVFRVPLEFTILSESLENLQPWMLDLRDNEALAVNCVSSLHKLVGNPRRPLDDFLGMIHGLEPSVVTLIVQDAKHNQDFVPRFVDALHYYSSIFDSLAAILPGSLVEREMVERFLLGNEIKNIVGCKEEARSERQQAVEEWSRSMANAGFQLSPLSGHAILQAKFLLTMYPVQKFCLINQEGYLSLGWQDNPLYAVSCWC